MKNFPTTALTTWFLKEKRALPWRENPTPYRVLVSEVMLQQTQAAAVEPYFIRWMYQFPTIEALAQASQEQVLRAWEGLGYYSRAKNLQKTAQEVVKHFQGKLPEEEDVLRTLPGLGPYTAAAVASFAFHKKAIALDANVLRVASRLFCLEEPIQSLRTKEKIRKKLLEVFPEEEPWVVMEALIELGATICSKTPSCAKCPLEPACLAKKQGKQQFLPIKKPPPAPQYLERDVIVAMHKGKILLRSPKRKGLFSGLYEFPYFLKEEGSFLEKITLFFKGAGSFHEHLPPIPQAFTKYRLRLFPSIWHLSSALEIEEHEWSSIEEANALPFSSAHRKIFESLRSAHYIYG